jgi:AcrR family transcriptional regulator
MPLAHSLKERQRQEREALILQVTEEILLEKGYAALSMDEIAARVGIAKATLYLHFSRKDVIVIHLFERDLRYVLDLVQQATTMVGTSKEKLVFLLHALYQDYLGRHGQLLSVLYNSQDLKATLKERLSQDLYTIADGVKLLLDEGKANNVFHARISTEVMLAIFFNLLSPQMYYRLVVEQQIAPEDVVFSIEQIYFAGIMAPLPINHP